LSCNDFMAQARAYDQTGPAIQSLYRCAVMPS
jgi:hypothetical protein